MLAMSSYAMSVFTLAGLLYLFAKQMYLTIDDTSIT